MKIDNISVSKERLFTLVVFLIGVIFLIVDWGGFNPDERYQSFFSMGFLTVIWIVIEFGWLSSRKNANKEKTMRFDSRLFFLLPLAFLLYDFVRGIYDSFPITDIFGWIILTASGIIVTYMAWLVLYDWNAFSKWTQSIKIKREVMHIAGLIGISYIIFSIVLVSIDGIMFLFGGSMLGIFIIILLMSNSRERSHPQVKKVLKIFAIIILLFVGIITSGEIYFAMNPVIKDIEALDSYGIFITNPVNLLTITGVIFMSAVIINKTFFTKSKYDEDFDPFRLPKT